MNILRRLPLSRLLLLCALVVAIGVSVDRDRPGARLGREAAAQAARAGRPRRARGAAGRRRERQRHADRPPARRREPRGRTTAQRARLEPAARRRLGPPVDRQGRPRAARARQAEKGDTRSSTTARTLSVYDAAENTLYRYTPRRQANRGTSDRRRPRTAGQAPIGRPKIEEAIAKLRKHANVSGATPANVAGQPAYTVRVSPKESGSLIGGAELSFDAEHGVPLRAALYSSTSSVARGRTRRRAKSPTAPSPDSVFDFTPPSEREGRRIAAEPREAHEPRPSAATARTSTRASPTHGHGIRAVAVLEGQGQARQGVRRAGLEELPKVKIERRRARASCAPRSARCSASSAPACATCSPARVDPPAQSRQSRGASSVAADAPGGAAAGRGARARQALQGGPRGRPRRPQRPRRRRLRLPRPQRRRQDDDAADGARADHAHRGHRRAVRARPACARAHARWRASPASSRRPASTPT